MTDDRAVSLSKPLSWMLTLILAASLFLVPAQVAFAEEANADKVGNLAIVASFDPQHDNINGGHSYLIFTSYQDGLTLEFTDLYGYYEMDQAFFEAAQKDETLWTHYNGNNADEVYPATMGAKDPADPQRRYASTEYTCVLNDGNFITIGNFTMGVDEGTVKREDEIPFLVKDSVMNSSIKEKLLVDLAPYLQGKDSETFLKDFAGHLVTIVEKNEKDLSTEIISNEITKFLEDELGQEGLEKLQPYFKASALYDGDTIGGVCVNREMWRQKNWQNLYPNMTYSIDIVQEQLDSMMDFLNGNSEAGSQNHYGALGHNCSTVSAAAWNAAVGYVRDANGRNTSIKSPLYIDSKDDTFDIIKGMFDTPKKVYEVLSTFRDDMGGTLSSMKIIHGVPRIKPAPEPEPQPQPQPEPKPADNNVVVVNDAAAGDSHVAAQTSDELPLTMSLLVIVASGAAVVIGRRKTPANE